MAAERGETHSDAAVTARALGYVGCGHLLPALYVCSVCGLRKKLLYGLLSALSCMLATVERLLMPQQGFNPSSMPMQAWYLRRHGYGLARC